MQHICGDLLTYAVHVVLAVRRLLCCHFPLIAWHPWPFTSSIATSSCCFDSIARGITCRYVCRFDLPCQFDLRRSRLDFWRLNHTSRQLHYPQPMKSIEHLVSSLAGIAAWLRVMPIDHDCRYYFQTSVSCHSDRLIRCSSLLKEKKLLCPGAERDDNEVLFSKFSEDASRIPEALPKISSASLLVPAFLLSE